MVRLCVYCRSAVRTACEYFLVSVFIFFINKSKFGWLVIFTAFWNNQLGVYAIFQPHRNYRYIYLSFTIHRQILNTSSSDCSYDVQIWPLSFAPCLTHLFVPPCTYPSTRPHIKESDVQITCRLSFWYYYYSFLVFAL